MDGSPFNRAADVPAKRSGDSVGMNHTLLEIITWMGLVLGSAGLIIIVFSVAVSIADDFGAFDADGPFPGAPA
jgi:hypothetical protein